MTPQKQQHRIVLFDEGTLSYKVSDGDGVLDMPVVGRDSFQRWLASLRQRGWAMVADSLTRNPPGRVVVVERPAR